MSATEEKKEWWQSDWSGHVAAWLGLLLTGLCCGYNLSLARGRGVSVPLGVLVSAVSVGGGSVEYPARGWTAIYIEHSDDREKKRSVRADICTNKECLVQTVTMLTEKLQKPRSDVGG